MNLHQTAKYALSVTAAAALLAGCSNGSNSQFAPSNGANATGARKAARNSRVLSMLVADQKIARTTVVSKHLHSIKPNCCAYAKTLFITDTATDEVQMFDFPSNTYIGQLSPPPEGFSEVDGACSDNKGDVYITNTGNEAIDEFAHDGSYMKTLQDSGQDPVACAFDRSSGNLAVSNIITASGSQGSISIYSKAKGKPTVYTDSGIQRMYFLGYMGKTGVLYLDGENSSYEFAYASFSGGTFNNIDISGANIEFPGTVAYSGKTNSMNVGDQEGAVLYQVSSTGQVTGSTPLSGSSDVVQGTVKGSRFIGPDAGNADVEIYMYPQGGSPQLTLTGYFSEPIGSAVSPDVPQ
jgi:hypothetical protein